MTERAWLLVWDGEWGDEGEGHEYVGVFDDEAEALRAAKDWERPAGFGSGGGYSVHPLRRNPTGPKED